MARITADQAGGQNRVAFLDMLAASDTGAGVLAVTDDGYNALVGSTPTRPLTFPSYTTHPNIFNARYQSTAAGRYQELHHNWTAYQPMLALPDFGPVSQDLMALQQIREARALPLIDAGHLNSAIALCAHLWASLPGADYGQHEQKLSDLAKWFTHAGGVIQ